MSIVWVWEGKGPTELRGRAFSEREGRRRGHVRRPQRDEASFDKKVGP